MIRVCVYIHTQYNTATLHDHACGIAHGLRKGPQPVLSVAEEQVLEDWLVEMSKIGYGRTKQQLQQVVRDILQKERRQNPFKDNMPGRKWVCKVYSMASSY